LEDFDKSNRERIKWIRNFSTILSSRPWFNTHHSHFAERHLIVQRNTTRRKQFFNKLSSRHFVSALPV